MDGALLGNARFASNKRIDLAGDEAAVSFTSEQPESRLGAVGLLQTDKFVQTGNPSTPAETSLAL